MIRISLAYFYRLGTELQKLRSLSNPIREWDARSILYSADTELAGLLANQFMHSSMRACYGPAQTLLRAIREITRRPWDRTDQEKQLDFLDGWAVVDAHNRFEVVFSAEMSVANTYWVTNKAAYDTVELISRGETLFPIDLPSKVPEAMYDVREAGKCLAFELSTAVGFHALRAVEAVLRRYWKAVSGGAAHPAQKNIGVYLKKMEKEKYGDAKVIAVLTQIKDLHRNPLMHPEDQLTIDDAIALIGIAQSAIVAMLKELPVLPINPEPTDDPWPLLASPAEPIV
jgi:hypothetical protein